MGEEDIVIALDKVAHYFFSGNRANDLLNLDLQFSLGVSFSKENGLFDSVNLIAKSIGTGACGNLPSMPSGRWPTISADMPYFADAV